MVKTCALYVVVLALVLGVARLVFSDPGFIVAVVIAMTAATPTVVHLGERWHWLR